VSYKIIDISQAQAEASATCDVKFVKAGCKQIMSNTECSNLLLPPIQKKKVFPLHPKAKSNLLPFLLKNEGPFSLSLEIIIQK
jgi:hypothetical protein